MNKQLIDYINITSAKILQVIEQENKITSMVEALRGHRELLENTLLVYGHRMMSQDIDVEAISAQITTELASICRDHYKKGLKKGGAPG